MFRRFSGLAGVATFLIAALSASPCSSASKWNIGVNNLYIMDYLQFNGKAPELAGSISTPRDLATIQKTLSTAAASNMGHIGAYREILELRYLEPTLNSTANYQYIDNIISVYAGYNVSLVLSFSAPAAPWMVVNTCPPPTATCDTVNIMPPAMPPEIPASLAPADPSASLGSAEFYTLSSNIGQSIGRYIDHLWNHTTIPHAWLSTRFYIEPYDEFDAIPSYLDGRTAYGTPRRAGQLYMAAWNQDFAKTGGSIQMTMPSVGGANAGLLYPGMNAPDAMGHWIQDYYAQTGVWGPPNIHITYGPFTTTAAEVALVRPHLATLISYIPQPQQGHLFLTEAGAPEQSSSCQGGLPTSERATLYSALAQDSGIGGSAQIQNLIMWRLQDLPASSSGCEASYGIITDGGDWKTSGQNLVKYLQSP